MVWEDMKESVSQNELVYRAIKADLLAGRYMPGQRLESRILSDRHASSSTPVRMALSRLAGERLVEIHANDGFHMPAITAKGVSDLFRFSNDQTLQCLSVRPRSGVDTFASYAGRADDPDFPEGVFRAIAIGSGNPEYLSLMTNLNDRLYLIRRLETSVLGDSENDVVTIFDSLRAEDWAKARVDVSEYHRRRQETSIELVKLLYLPR